MADGFSVVAGSGTLMSRDPGAVHFPHRWTPGGVTVDADFTGAHLFHLAAAGCVLNDLHREAGTLGLPLHGARVRASGVFDTNTWASRGITYAVELDSPASPEELTRLLELVDEVAEIPRAIRIGAPVTRSG